MKNFLYTAVAIILFTPAFVWALPSAIDRITNHIEPLIKTDYIKATNFVASSTSATSSFPVASSSTFCLSSDCRTVWPSGVSSGLSTSSPWTNGNLAYVTGQGSVGSVATGTLTETVSGIELNATRALIGGSAILAITSGYEIPLTASTSNWQTAYASTTAMTPTYTRGLFSNTATGLTYTGATGVTALTAGYNIPLSASTTEWSNFYATPSTRITAGTGLSWSGNTLNASGGSNWTIESGGLRTSTTTDFAKASYFIATSTTATSTFAGYVGIGTTTPTTPLSVVGDSLVTATSTVQSKLFVGTRGAGTANGPWSSGIGFGNFVSSCDGCGGTSGNVLGIANFGTGPTGINTFSARGTTNAPTATQSGDDIYFMGGRGYGSSTWATGSKVAINMEASQTWTDSAQGTKITLSTTPNNSTTRADVMTIDQSARVGIGTTTPSQKLSVVGTTTMDRTEITSSLWLLGDYITNTLTWLDTKVEALTNVVLQGIWDFGGATSIEIVNGTAPVVDAIGEIAFDTTDNQLLISTSTNAGAPAVLPTTVSMGSFLFSSTSMPFGSGFVTGKAIPFKIHRDGYNVTEIWCDIDGGTSIVINFDNGTGNTSTVTCDTDGASLVGVGANALVTAGLMTTAIETGTVTGLPDYLRVSVFGTWTKE